MLRWSPLANMPSATTAIAAVPARWTGGGYRSPESHRVGLPRKIAGSASTFCCFEACSAFTLVTACLLAESPYAILSIEGSDGFVTSTAAPIATGWSEQLPGGT